MARRGTALALVMVAVAACASGCAVLFVSTDNLSGGALPVEAAAGDGASDGNANDDGALLDASASADADADAAAKGYCASNPGHTYCDDFDEEPDVTKNWNRSSSGRGALRTDTLRARSAPRSFLSETPAGDTAISNAQIERPVGTSDRVRFAFDMFVTAPPAPVGDTFAVVAFPGGYLDLLWFTNGAVWITERTSAPNIDHVATKPLAAGKWVRVQVETAPGRIVAKLDGETVIDVTTTKVYSGAARVGLGLYSEDAFAIAFHYDNVLVDTSF